MILMIRLFRIGQCFLVVFALVAAVSPPAICQTPTVEEGGGEVAAQEYAAFRSEYWDAFSDWLAAKNSYWSDFEQWKTQVPEGEPKDGRAYIAHKGPLPVDPSAESVPAFEGWIERGAGTDIEIDARNDLLTILGNGRRFDEWTGVFIGLMATAPTHDRVGGRAGSATYVTAEAGRWDEVHETLLGILEKHPTGDSAAGILYALAEKHQDDGELAEARAYYQRLVAEFETHWYGEQAAAALYELASLRPGMVAPAFTGTSLDGQPIALEDHKGKVVLLEFWATWCGPCLGEMPHVVALRDSFSEDDLVILGISLDEDLELLTTFLAESKILGIPDRSAGEAMAWPQLCDGGGSDSELARLYRVNAIPRTYVIDAEGLIAHKDLRGDELKEALVAMIDG